METPDPANDSKDSAKFQGHLLLSPSDLCNACALPSSETEWKFSIEDGVNKVKGGSGFQGKEKKISKLGRVSYRRSSKRVSCP